jgi:uncharacterized protein (DUF983 family)
MTSNPERGSTQRCPHCGIGEANQHTLSESAVCDGVKNGHIDPSTVKNGKITKR